MLSGLNLAYFAAETGTGPIGYSQVQVVNYESTKNSEIYIIVCRFALSTNVFLLTNRIGRRDCVRELSQLLLVYLLLDNSFMFSLGVFCLTPNLVIC